MEIFDLDGHNLGTVFLYNPIIIAYFEIGWRSDSSRRLTLFNDHIKAVVIKGIVQENDEHQRKQKKRPCRRTPLEVAI